MFNRRLLKQQRGTKKPEGQRLWQSPNKNLGVVEVWGGYGEGLSIGFKEVLSNHKTTEKGKSGFRSVEFAFVLFADGVLLLASSDCGLHQV